MSGAGFRSGRWGGHAVLGAAAFESLPAWERELIRPDMRPEALAKPYFPGRIETPGEKVAVYCLILDYVYNPEMRPYATLPDGRWIPHSMPDADMQSCVGSRRPKSCSACDELIRFLMDRMVKALRTEDWEEAVRFGGALGHFVQEPFTPGHAFGNEYFHLFFRDPDEGRHVRLHFAFDSASNLFEPLPPRLLGLSVPEAALRLQAELDKGVRAAGALVPAVVQSVYDGRPQLVRQALLAEQCRQAARATASAWHTAFSIAFDRFAPEEREALGTLDLTDLTPFFLHHTAYTSLLPGRLVKDGRTIPIHVRAAGPSGAAGEELVERGFGMTGYMGIKFFVNGDVFPRFRCRVGLPTRQTEGQTARTDTVFSVQTDDRENLVYSEEIEYKARTVAKVRLVPGAPAIEVSADIRGARTLILKGKSEPYTDPETGAVRFDIPHIAVCEPVLLKE